MAIMEQIKMAEAAPEGGSKPPSTTPAYFVIVHQAQGDNKEERILVANKDASAVAPVVQRGPHESKSNTFLSADCVSGGITVSLDNNNMWNEFYRCSTEMVLTKQGRRMFPYCRYWISGMDPYQKYILAMDITPLDTHKYKWNGKWWEPGGKAEPHVLGRAFIHPESPSTGQYWMHQPVSFYKLKLTNNIVDQEGHIILHSMHRYLPRLHVIPADKATEVIQLNGPDVHTFTFPQTEFFAVTAYQNLQITQLKIDCNPFAKGFREGTVLGRPKDGRPKILTQAKVSPGSKKLENESTGKLKDCFSMSEQSDAETESESLNTKPDLQKPDLQKPDLQKPDLQKPDLQNLSNSQTTVLEQLLLKLNKLDSFSDTQVVAAPSVPVDPPTIKIKEEPEDDYDYSKSEFNAGVQVKQEASDEEITDNYSHSDDDYPILERHFAQFSTKLHSDRKRSVKSPSGVAKAKLLKRDDGKMPKLYLQSCSAKKNTEHALTNNTMRSIKQEEDPPRLISIKREEFTRSEEKRPIKRKIYADYAVPLNVRAKRGSRKKDPSMPAKTKAAITPGNDGGVPPVPKRRGRPPKNKGARVGRPPKKKPPIIPPQFPDFKPDLEDVDGVLFVAFSSKEALDVHTVGKPKTEVPIAPPEPEVHVELTEEQKKILDLEKQLLGQLKAMRHRQVIHPSLQQVGLRLNIVDHAMSIDLRYLGVELPLPFITSDSRLDNGGLSSEGHSFVSRTGKTTDVTKIKGWRDKFSANPSVKTEAGSETTLKNRSAFCSDELDEYLENEAKLMEDFRGTSQNETFVSTVNFQFPTKSSSYVRTLDSVLKKQALQASANAINISKPPPPPEPVKKRKYTRRKPVTKRKSKNPKPEIEKPESAASVALEKPAKPHSPKKPKSPKRLKLTPSQCVKSPTTSQPGETPPLSDNVTVQPSVLSPGEDSLLSGLYNTPFQSPPYAHRSSGLSKVQMKLLELEESAICQGKPRTYVTEERAEIALSALLTIQGFLKRKTSHKTIGKQTSPCKKECCRLGCICTDLNNAKHKPADCQQEARVLGSDGVDSKLCHEDDGANITSATPKLNSGEDLTSSTEERPATITGDTPPTKHTDETDKDRKSQEYIEKPCIPVHDLTGCDSNTEAIETPKRKSGNSADFRSKRRSMRTRAAKEKGSEPRSVLEKGEVVEMKTPFQRRQSERVKSSANKSSHLYTSKHAVHPDDLDLEDSCDYYTMTCARTRVYKHKATLEKIKKEPDDCAETPVKESNHKPNKYKEREKENAGSYGKRHKKTDSSSSTKLFNIISESGCEQEPKNILNIVSPHDDNKEPQSFRVGRFNFKLTSENKGGGDASKSATSHVKISMAADQKTDEVLAKPPPVKEEVENITPPEQISVETRAQKAAKSHGGKGLPFYTKVIPAGKLIAQLKNSTVNQSELIQVNGKKFPQAKLLLGQMGALHPANRIAAYITHRLRPSLLYLSKAKESAKLDVSNAGQEPSMAKQNVETATDGEKTADTLPPSETVTSPPVSTPRATLTSGLEKRMGPRLLLIPVANGSAPFRPIQCVQTGPGKRVVLQPIKGPNGVNLFKHPNGQIIQLVPLQQTAGANAQQSQRVVIRRTEMDPNIGASTSTGKPGLKQKRRSYEAAFKLKVVSRAEESNNSIASREFCVEEKLVRDWRKMKADLEKIPKGKKARRGLTTPHGALETELHKWVMECRQNGYCVTPTGIRLRALHMAKDEKFKVPGTEKFVASAGWCTRFMNRFGLCLRQRTKITQKLPKDLDEKVRSFHSFIIKQRRIHNYDLQDIGNMDETPMTFDLPSNRTVASLGDNTILRRTTGNEKNHFTVVLSCLANGTKLRPVIIFKRKTLPKKVKFPPRITVRAHIKGWMDEDGTKKWMEEIWNGRPGAALKKKPSLLVWDMFRAHTSDDIKKLAKSSQITLVVIPGGLTSVLQPLDVCIYKAFKDHVRKMWHEWMSSGQAQLTKIGNLRKPGLELIAQWVRDAWEDIPEDLVQRAFKKCGISNAMDGSEDDMRRMYEDDSSDGEDCEVSDDDNVYADNIGAEEAEALFGHTDDEEENSSFEGF